MKLLLKREQTNKSVRRVHFKLWAKLELDNDEKALMSRYRMNDALLMGENEAGLIRRTAIYSLLLAFGVGVLFSLIVPNNVAVLICLLVGAAFAYWYYNEQRDQIFVQDLLNGRHFKCPSIIDLTKKEAEISEVTAIFRQVLESAKHWGGTETEDIPVLSRDEARALILKVF